MFPNNEQIKEIVWDCIQNDEMCCYMECCAKANEMNKVNAGIVILIVTIMLLVGGYVTYWKVRERCFPETVYIIEHRVEIFRN
jgi:uncharacterized membrane protein YidH (DUF202 family)